MKRLKKKSLLHAASYHLLTIIILIQFQVCVVCDLHGFSPQEGEVFAGESGKNKRDGGSFYNALHSTTDKFYGKYNEFSKTGEILTREIRVKQGRLKGLVREFKNKKLKNVETFLGIPYAAAPVKALRFMPPGSPPSWTDVKIFDTFGPVCPQRPPDLTREPLKTMNAGQYNRLKGLMPFLTNQSEDCLYLNIYAPEQDFKHPKKFPVVVYIHGESFEWNSGNPYDGSILASYGNVVVVTINFRLGILGFLKPGLSEHTVSNFGLLDQIAALQWIKDNIGEFGGDSSMVTLMGQGTGAACINFLMVSPVSMAFEGLFHKAILMSGTALSDWAVTHNPLQFTIQVAEALNCPLVEKNDELSNCLRRKRLSEIMSVKVNVPEFQTPFGPIVDGSMVPNTPQQVMGVYQSLFTRYDLLYGVTEWEAYNLLDPVSLTYGMLEEERNELLKKYMYSRFEALPYFALATTLSEYLDLGKSIQTVKSAAEEHRDLVLDLLSDARFAAPILQMASYHSRINPKSYLYVFKHRSIMGEYAGNERSVSGDEIAYAFGTPLLNEESPLSHHRFTLEEQLLSEFMLTYFTNFVKTGNPNAPRRVEYLSLGPKEWQEFDAFWPEYDSQNQSYLSLDIPPRVSHHYRLQMIQFWNKILPDLLSNPTKVKQHKPNVPKVNYDDFSKPPFIRKTPSEASLYPHRRKPIEDRDSWTYGTVRLSPNEFRKDSKPFRTEEETPEGTISKQMDHPFETEDQVDLDSLTSHSTWIPHLVAITLCLLLINATVIAIYFYKKKQAKPKKSWRETTPGSIGDGGFEERLKRVESFYASMDYSENEPAASEPQENRETTKKGNKLKALLNRDSSEGTSKVKRWIQTEILKKSSKRKAEAQKAETKKKATEETVPMKTLLKKNKDTASTSSTSEVPRNINSILKTSKRIYKSNEELNAGTKPKRHIEKVSVGIDATPSSRGDSVLKQTPIELTKSLDGGILVNNNNNNNNDDDDVDLKIRTDSLRNIQQKEGLTSTRRSRTSISLQILPTNDDKSVKFITSAEPEIIKLVPKSEITKNRFLTFFDSKCSRDVNVTSRDSVVVSASEGVHVDPLENIQKRNFPKVLPDFPDFKAIKRLSFPQPTLLNIVESNRNKLQEPERTRKSPPRPPPRISTLQRKDKQISENQTGETPKFLTFSSLNLKTPENKTGRKETGNEREEEKEEGDKEEVSSTSEKSSSTQENSVKENPNIRKREPPSIIIKPKIGPRKEDERNRTKVSGKKARVTLQAKGEDKGKNTIENLRTDTKGPSDRPKPPAKTK